MHLIIVGVCAAMLSPCIAHYASYITRNNLTYSFMKKSLLLAALTILSFVSMQANITVRSKVPAEWSDNIYGYIYTPTSERGWYETTQEGEWHCFTYTGAETSIGVIFCSNTSKTFHSEKHYQTTNIANITEDKCIEITFNPSTGTDNTDKSTWTNTDCPVDMATVYFINSYGWNEVHMHTWSPKLDDNGTYGVLMAKTDVTFNAYDVYEYSLDASKLGPCLFNDGAWGKYEHQTDNTTMIGNADKYYYKGLWYSSLEDCEQATLATDFCLAGSFNSWNATANRFMKEAEDAEEASVAITVSEYSDISFKIVEGGAWCGSSNAITKDANTATIAAGGVGGNISMTPYAAGEYIFTLNLSTRILTVTYPEGEQMPIPTNIFLACDVLNSWAEDNADYKFSVEEDWATLAVNLEAETAYAFKLVYNSAWFGANYNFNYYWNTDVKMVKDATQANLYTFKAGTYTFRYQLSTSELTIDYPATGPTAVSISEYEYATLYSNHAFDIPGEVEAYIITGAEGIRLTTERVWRIPAQTGVLLHAPQGTYDFYEGDGRYMDAITTNLLKGTTADAIIDNDAVHYVLSYSEDGKVGLFWPYGTGANNGVGAFTNNAGKAYLEISTQAAGVIARRGYLLTEQQDAATSMPTATLPVEHGKFLHDGQLLILHDGHTYNAQGVQVR